MNGADFEESLFPPLQCKIRGNGHRSINHATRVHARFDDGFKWFHVDRFRFLPWRKIGLNPRKASWWNDRNFYYLYFPMCILYYVFFFSNLCEYLCTNFVRHRCESSRIGFYDRIKCIIYQNDKYVNWRNGKWRYVNYGKWNKKGKKKKKKKNVSAAVYSEWHLLIAFRASTSTSRNKKGAILLMMIFAIMIYRARGRFSCGFHGFRKKNLFYTTIEK